MGKDFTFSTFSFFGYHPFVLLFTKGLNLGIDFLRGTLIQVQYTKAAPINDIREILLKTALLKSIGQSLGVMKRLLSKFQLQVQV